MTPHPRPSTETTIPGHSNLDLEAAPARAQGYRPWLDGVRGIAVLLVVAEHVAANAGVTWLPEGMGEAGVGLFFGLSGYLITGLLLDELARDGRVRLGAFYARRTARLLPALVTALVGGCALLVWLGRDGVPGVAAAVLLYVANYVTILQGDYLTGFGQAWSLAVEEHFYLVWPLVLLLMLRRTTLRTAIRWTLAACAVTLLWRTFLVVGTDVTELLVYHGSLERADALLYGCAAAMAVRAGWQPQAWLAYAGAVGIGVVIVVSDQGALGMTLVQALTGVASAALVVALDERGSVLSRSLSWRPLVGVGMVSYGIYLWHWVLLIAWSQTHPGHPWGVVAVGFLLTPAVATASYVVVERPARRWVRARLDRGARVPATAS